MLHKEKALAYFENNFNCSQAVFASFATEMGVSEELALKLGTEFGGGARCGQLCGAVSGALLVLGLKYGHYEAENGDQKSKAYALAVDFNKRFCSKHKSVVCKELLGYDVSDPEDMAIIKEKGLFGTKCPQCIADAVDIVERICSENR
ncbi:C-GCAxxG-C-C family protein [Treponema brennaborense]|uniref:C_GCAxxG_C_C family protein n=1 Tax=Treponema brennaborense (strain DSM 12168 / CIP 105900 / DD5/3) TaxID=906968 RepID=F4LL48_TREBD|nr:C-GCAxxG-C-C family protein [Treponema brennaborense]AEE17622.1 C_GCAxxG_C_C family protein [Treponema brennaborense DSM 12168]